MKIKYLGTAAAEGIPALFCRCPVCEYAREHGGKEIRTRQQVMIDDEILLDFGPDTYMHVLRYGLDLARVGMCLITHTHGDHFFAGDFIMRGRNFALYDREIPPLHVCGSTEVEEVFGRKENQEITADGRVIFQKARAYQEILHKEYSVVPLPAVHGTKEPFIYLVQHSGKSILYAHDTDVFCGEVWDYLREKGILLNLISLDCTEGIRHMDYSGHMNLERNFVVRERMRQMGIADGNTVFVASHISHNGQLSHCKAEMPEFNRGIVIAYDGLELSC